MMSEKSKADNLIIPVYINEKTVIDMLAILEDGFSMVSQVSYSEYLNSNAEGKARAQVGTSSAILSKLLKIDIAGEIDRSNSSGKDNSVSKEKYHTNASLLSKFRAFLIEQGELKSNFDISSVSIGDFIELEGELQKNPIINYLDIFANAFRLSEAFTETPQLGDKKQAKEKQRQEKEIAKQMQALANDLKHSGTIDFILCDSNCTAVLSVQEQYLANDNVSELIGGRFKVLGKVISIYESEKESIDLLRKTTLSILPEKILNDMVEGFKDEELKEYHLPRLVTKINGPAVIVLPVAIYA